MNSVEMLEYYQAKCGYNEIDDESIDTVVNKIFNDMSSELSVDKIALLKDSLLSELEAYKVQVPTKYQSFSSYAILDRLFKKINKTANELFDKSKIKIPQRVTYGTVHINQFAASVQSTDDNNDYLIMVSDCLFMFANLLAKSIGLLLVESNQKNKTRGYSYSLSKEHISNELNNKSEAIIRFTDLILAYIVTGQASCARQYTPNLKLAAISQLIMESYELFVVSHEYSHVLLGHLQIKEEGKCTPTGAVEVADEIIKVASNNWKHEFEADALAANLTINAMEGYDFATSYMGVDIGLITLIILDRINGLLGVEVGINLSHPPAETRRKMIFDILYKYDNVIENIYETNTYVVDSLWNRCMYIIVKINDFYEKTLKSKLVNIDYGITQNLLYKMGEMLLSNYNEEKQCR